MWYHKFINYGSLADADEFPSAKFSDLSQAHHYWEFKIIQINSVLIGFECMSRENMACGVGYIINYEFKTGEYSGYRIDLIHPELIPLLLSYFIDPTFTLIPGEEWDPNDYAKRMSATRQVNWGGTILPLLNNTIKMYGQDFGVDPASVEDLQEMEYITIPKPVQQWWGFSFLGKNPILMLIATNTDEMVLGPDWTITLDVDTGRIAGSIQENLSLWVEAGFIEVPIYIRYQGAIGRMKPTTP